MRARLHGLDGLRGVAVSCVVLFHAGVELTPGGFLGVDMFFALSGFLITSLLLHEIEVHGAIDVKRFYARRARRLLPALGVVLVAVVLSSALLATDAAYHVGRDIVPALGFVLNWAYIAQAQSYFESIARPPLLQHVWSLAIEEQFYLLWPLALMGIGLGHNRVTHGVTGMRLSVRHVLALVAATLCIASTVWMCVLSLGSASLTRMYFGTDTHAGGLLAGAALAALLPSDWATRTLRTNHERLVAAMGIAGLVTVAVMALTVTETATFPYRGGFLLAAVATLTAIVSAVREGTAVSRLLETPVLRWLGDRSYGIYLWHWPVFELTRPGVDVNAPDPGATIVRIAAVFIIADLSLRYIELPVRRGQLGPALARLRGQFPDQRTALIVVSAVTVLAACLTGIAAAPSPAATGAMQLSGITSLDSDEGIRSTPTQTTSDYDYPHTVVFGDSVVLSGRVALAAAIPNIAFDAAVSRQPRVIAARIALRRDQGRLGNDVVIHMGTNGRVNEEDLRPILESLRDRRRVVVVDVAVPRRWMAASNRTIIKIAREFPNVRLADWRGVSRGHRDYFVRDGVHLTRKGGSAFAAMVAKALSAP